MKDGHYLGTYLNPPGLPRLVNTWLRHDNNVSLWEKSGSTIKLLRYWELERSTGVKYDGTGLFESADVRTVIDSFLETEGLSFDDLVEVWGTPGVATVDDYRFVDDREDIAYHSLCHLFSAMLLDSEAFYEGQVLGLAVDGGPDSVLERSVRSKWYAGGVARGGDLALFPVESPGPLWLHAGRRFKMREGSLMALASATESAVPVDRRRILNRFTFYDQWIRRAAPAALDMLIDEVATALRARGGRRFTCFDPQFSEEENFISVVMKEVQAISAAIMERNIERVLDRFHLDPSSTNLAIAGGFALNCPTNSHLMDKYGFRRFMAPPCVGDSGQSLGISLGAFHQKLGGRQFSFRFPGPYLGGEQTDLERCLDAHDQFVADVSELNLERAVEDLVRGPVVWVNGKSEIGPRALGNRSVLGDPRTLRMKAELNRVKQRQWWRPVAPVVMEEYVHEWFDNARSSPYMLETFRIRKDRRSRIPAVAHLDESARIQTLTRAGNPPLHDLLAAFDSHTGVPLLCNTSLNDKGEPIVENADQAINFCLRKRLPVAYLNGRRVAFRNFDHYPWDRPLPRDGDELFRDSSPAKLAAAGTALNPHGVPDRYLHMYLWNPVLKSSFDVTVERDARRLCRAIRLIFAAYPDTADRLEQYLVRIAQDYAEFAKYRRPHR